MSILLRSTLKYPIKQFGIDCLKLSDGVFISRNLPCMNQPASNNSFHVNAVYLSSKKAIKEMVESNEPRMKKLKMYLLGEAGISIQKVDDIFEGIESTESEYATEAQCLMVIRCLVNLLLEETPRSEKGTQLVQKIWNNFEKKGIKFDIGHYNALLRAYLEKKQPFVPTEILAELEQRGMEPNRVTYQHFIIRYRQMDNFEEIIRIWQLMREKEMHIDDIDVFNALVLSYSMMKDMTGAEGILNVMRQASIEPTVATYGNLIYGHVRQGDLDKVLILQASEIYEILSKVKCPTELNRDIIDYVCYLDGNREFKREQEEWRTQQKFMQEVILF